MFIFQNPLIYPPVRVINTLPGGVVLGANEKEEHTMEAKYNVTGTDRKALVAKISEILQTKAKYLGMPSAAYQIGDCTVSKDGTLSTEADATELIEALKQAGYTPEEDEPATIAVSMPAAMFDEAALTNLKRLVESKGELMKRAFRVDALPIETSDEKVTFPWFSGEAAPEEVAAYTVFIQKICEMAKRQKRINQTRTAITNEKYEFRCFLLRLGMIGDEYKAERKILMRNLTGSAAFKKA